MPHTQEYTDTFIIALKLFLVGLGGLYFMSNLDGTPCTQIILNLPKPALQLGRTLSTILMMLIAQDKFTRIGF